MSVATVQVTVDGQPVTALAGQTVAAVLMSAGRLAVRRSPTGSPRGVYCAIGICQECRVQVEGRGPVRSCLLAVQAGMRITTDAP